MTPNGPESALALVEFTFRFFGGPIGKRGKGTQTAINSGLRRSV